ncbi:guanylate-binding protein 1-like isoform X1 [Scyliorhinus canicula]|uniref:guanylate-binding protein 1-like isoform X1 n=1 Tax=Scyliorhinus canicula TaxID=7830 RepID=UPI0018F4E862|nr:guanylate-binding protein 1-like isoform X1 [Scyliorhinus canicula]
MASYTGMEPPMHLIMNSADGKLSVAKDAVDMLKKMNQPLVVVALVGKYRTGKSFLLNRLAGRKTGFPVGGSVQSETKGIWMWCLPHPRRDNRCMVLLDTEGLGDVEKILFIFVKSFFCCLKISLRGCFNHSNKEGGR